MATLSTLRQRRTELELEWSRWLAGRRSGADLRSEVIDSWRRSLSTVDPGRDSAPVLDDVRLRWSSSPLRRPVAELSDELRSIADDAGFIAAVTDESGTILWTCGGRVMQRRAERVNFAPGGRWGEEAMGTNALSLALRTGRPASIFSAEHLVEALHGWCCWSAPIRDVSGRVLGVLDLSTTWDRAHPLAMSTVRTLVTTIENRLHAITPAPAGVSLTCLGRGHATLDGTPLRLSPRQLELLALFALEPGGFSLDQLREALYGDIRVSPNTVRAEVSHLRRVLGGALANRRYALTRPISCDAVDVLAALKAGDAATAVERYTGPLLPESEAPGVTAWREQLEVAVREAVLASYDPALALRYGERHPFDIQVHEHAHATLPAGDPRRALAGARLRLALRD